MLRKETADDSVMFEIKNIVEQTKTGSFDYYNINRELEEFNDGRANNNKTNFKRSISESGPTNDIGEQFIRKKPRFLSG